MYTLDDFNAEFPDDRACLDWLVQERYSDGCPQCGSKLYYIYARNSYACSKHHQVSPTANTIFHKSHQPFRNWFYVIYLVSTYGDNVTALGLHRQLGITYKTCWRMLDLIRDTYDPERKKKIMKSVGVYPSSNGKFRARTKVAGKTLNLGTFDTHEEARAAYDNAKAILKTKPRYWAK